MHRYSLPYSQRWANHKPPYVEQSKNQSKSATSSLLFHPIDTFLRPAARATIFVRNSSPSLDLLARLPEDAPAHATGARAPKQENPATTMPRPALAMLTEPASFRAKQRPFPVVTTSCPIQRHHQRTTKAMAAGALRPLPRREKSVRWTAYTMVPAIGALRAGVPQTKNPSILRFVPATTTEPALLIVRTTMQSHLLGQLSQLTLGLHHRP